MPEAKKVRWEESEGTLYLNGLPVSLSVLEAIVNPDHRVLWRFVLGNGGKIVAVPFTEEQVVWLE